MIKLNDGKVLSMIFLLPLVGLLGSIYVYNSISPFILLLFIPGISVYLYQKATGIHISEINIVVEALSIFDWQRSRKIRRIYNRIEAEVIDGVRIFSSLVSILIASQGQTMLAVFVMLYGLITAHFLDEARKEERFRRFLEEASEKTQRDMMREMNRRG